MWAFAGDCADDCGGESMAFCNTKNHSHTVLAKCRIRRRNKSLKGVVSADPVKRMMEYIVIFMYDSESSEIETASAVVCLARQESRSSSL